MICSISGLVLFTLQMPDAKKPSKCDIESSCHTNFDKATTAMQKSINLKLSRLYS